MKKIAYITGSRAEYGIVINLLNKFNHSEDIDLRIIATGMHLDSKFGNTYLVIEEDGFTLDAKIAIELDTSSHAAILHSMAICQSEFGQYFYNNKFDAIILLGDRYEIMAVAIAAAIHNIPIIHLHGGEKTLGNYDEFIRHCITKMSKLHLTSTREYAKRVIQMGEAPNSVYNIGSLGAENSLKMDLLSGEELNAIFSGINKKYYVVLFHPETITNEDIEQQVNSLIFALNVFKHDNDFVFIGANADTHSNIIDSRIRQYADENKFKFLTSVRAREYLSLLKMSQGLIGNSSSGIIEAPSLGIATINIGLRQAGRVRGDTVLDISWNSDEIISAIKKIKTIEFKKIIKSTKNPYFKPDTSQNAYLIIREFLYSKSRLALKDFYDL